MGIGQDIGVDRGLNVGSSGRGFIGGADWQLPVGHYETAQIPLEIINPQEGLTTGTAAPSYYYRCYPGLKWRVPISVLGGAWPFEYDLTTFPAGMTLGKHYGDTDYGILEWINPTVGNHSIVVTVTDQEGNLDTHSWSLEATTLNAIFVDAVNGTSGGDGSINDALQTIHDWWGDGAGSMNDATYQGFHVYYRTGVYYPGYDWDSTSIFSGQMKMRGYKPMVHIAYPGEVVTIDEVGDGGLEHTGGQFFFADGPTHNDIFFGGFNLEGICRFSIADVGTSYWQQFFYLGQLTNRCVIFDNTMQNQAGGGASGNNPSYLFLTDQTPNRLYTSVHNNTVDSLEAAGAGTGAMMLSETYASQKIVFEENTVEGAPIGLTHLVYFKVDTELASIRNNVIHVNTDIFYMGTASNDASAYSFHNLECCWNDCKVSSYRQVQLGIEAVGNGVYKAFGEVFLFRNTLTGGYIQHGFGGTIDGLSVNYFNNVRQYESGIEGITTVDAFTATVNGLTNELTATSGLVDTITNLLTPAYEAQRGLKGHEVK